MSLRGLWCSPLASLSSSSHGDAHREDTSVSTSLPAVDRVPLPFTWQPAALICGEQQSTISDGYRFQRVLGLPMQQYADLRSKVMCPPGLWTKKEARRQAVRLVEHPSAWRVIVMLGRRTSLAFCYERPCFSYDVSLLNSGVQLVSLPKLDSREWNDHRLVRRARQILREVIPSLPWGVQYDNHATLAFSLRCAAECALWTLAVPAGLRERLSWDDDELMVALDAVEAHGLDRARGEYISRVRYALRVSDGGQP
jgi:hypothetical protein